MNMHQLSALYSTLRVLLKDPEPSPVNKSPDTDPALGALARRRPCAALLRGRRAAGQHGGVEASDQRARDGVRNLEPLHGHRSVGGPPACMHAAGVLVEDDACSRGLERSVSYLQLHSKIRMGALLAWAAKFFN